MQDENYRTNVKDALRNLIKVNESIYSSIINIAMQGELKEFNDSVPIGETHQFNFDLFRNSDDATIQLLVKLIYEVETTFESIMNINGIKEDEE
ncbi:MAG: hypothetical protein EOP48_31345 [Sphingobacteriales bacterium]|nr:MAG: hypothetical protein EOP48_31345 [Sphingobacteriales bacterium]